MKKIFIPLLFLFFTNCTYTRIGDLTMVSTRNIDSKTDYVLLKKYVRAKGKSKKGEGTAMEEAIDNAVRQVENGEFMKNVKIYINASGKKIKVEGDIWGIPPQIVTTP